MFGLRKTLNEFEQMSNEDQAWAIATWRTKQRLSAIEAVESYRKHKK